MSETTPQTLKPRGSGTQESQRRLKIAYVIDSLRRGGAEGQVVEMLRHLDRNEFDPMLAVLDSASPEFVAPEVKFATMGLAAGGNMRWQKRLPAMIKATMRLRKLLREWQPDVVHALLPTSCILATIAGRAAGIPAIVASRRSLVAAYRGPKGLAAAVDRWSLRRADVAVANSLAVAADMAAEGCPKSKIVTVYNGVDTARFHPGIGRELRLQLGWPDQAVVLGMVANFSVLKRHDFLLAVAELLWAKHPEMKLLLAGSDRGALRQVRDQIATKGIADKVRIVENELSPERIYAATDIYVSTSSTEGLSNALLEAMSSAKPVVATDVGGNSELVVEGETGFLTPVDDPHCFADAVERLLVNPALRQSFGGAARQRVTEKFSVSQLCDAYAALYERLATADHQTR